MTAARTFRGRSLEEVLPQVKRELGDDAVILDRREVLDGGVGGFFQQRTIEVDAASATAARVFAAELERAEEDIADGLAEVAPAPPPAPAHRPHVDARVADVSMDDLFHAPRQDAGLASLFAAGREEPKPDRAALTPAGGDEAPRPRDADFAAALEARGVDAPIAAEVVAEAAERLAPLQPGAEPRELVATALARRIPVARLGAGPRVVAIVGTGGSGKTTLAGRLEGGSGVTVLDTPAFSPRDRDGLRKLAADLRAAGAAEVHLVLPATTGVHAARELLRAVGDLGVTALAVSHTDETGQLGTAVGLAIETGLPVSYVGGAAPDARALAEELLS